MTQPTKSDKTKDIRTYALYTFIIDFSICIFVVGAVSISVLSILSFVYFEDYIKLARDSKTFWIYIRGFVIGSFLLCLLGNKLSHKQNLNTLNQQIHPYSMDDVFTEINK